MSKIADDSAGIAHRLKELEAERLEARTGSSAPVTGQESRVGEYAMGWPYSPSSLNDAARQYMAYRQAANRYNPYSGLQNQMNQYNALAQQSIANYEAQSRPVFDNSLRGWIKASG